MKVELSRIRIKKGKSHRVDKWFATLNARKAECIETLEREKAYVEAIFREKIEESDDRSSEEEFIYWFIVQGENGESLETSPFEIDAIHRAFAEECLDRSYPRTDWNADVSLLAAPIAEMIGE